MNNQEVSIYDLDDSKDGEITPQCLINFFGPSLYDRMKLAKQDVLIESVPELALLDRSNVIFQEFLPSSFHRDVSLVKQEFFMSPQLAGIVLQSQADQPVRIPQNYWRLHQIVVDYHQGLLGGEVKESHQLQLLPFGFEVEQLNQSVENFSILEMYYSFGPIYSFRLVIDSVLRGRLITDSEEVLEYKVYDYAMVPPVWQLSQNECQIVNEEYLIGRPLRRQGNKTWRYTFREAIAYNKLKSTKDRSEFLNRIGRPLEPQRNPPYKIQLNFDEKRKGCERRYSLQFQTVPYPDLPFDHANIKIHQLPSVSRQKQPKQQQNELANPNLKKVNRVGIKRTMKDRELYVNYCYEEEESPRYSLKKLKNLYEVDESVTFLTSKEIFNMNQVFSSLALAHKMNVSQIISLFYDLSGCQEQVEAYLNKGNVQINHEQFWNKEQDERLLSILNFYQKNEFAKTTQLQKIVENFQEINHVNQNQLNLEMYGIDHELFKNIKRQFEFDPILKLKTFAQIIDRIRFKMNFQAKAQK